MDFRKRISSDVNIMGGKPCIKGTRVPVYVILDQLGAGESFDDVLENYPSVTLDDIRACFAYAAHLADEAAGPLKVGSIRE